MQENNEPVEIDDPELIAELNCAMLEYAQEMSRPLLSTSTCEVMQWAKRENELAWVAIGLIEDLGDCR